MTDSVYSVAADLQMDGVSVPWTDFAIDMNVYALSSTITAHGPISVGDDSTDSPFADYSNATDWTAICQKASAAGKDVPMAVLLSYGAATSPSSLVAPMMSLEQGILDVPRAHYVANQWEWVGRSTASVFQDNPTADNLPRNISGVDLVKYFFNKRSIPLTVFPGFTSQTVQGKAFDDSNYQRSLRNSTEWDYMQDAASSDGCVITLHNGQGYYGPAAGAAPPTVMLRWPDDIALDDEGSNDLVVESASRRAHFITVIVESWNPRTGGPVSARYATGGGGGSSSQTFRFFVPGLDLHKARGMAFAIWSDLTTKEVIVNFDTVPTPELMAVIAKNGCNFLVQLQGGLPSHNLLYHVKQASTKIAVSDTEDKGVSAIVSLILENHVPIGGQGAYV